MDIIEMISERYHEALKQGKLIKIEEIKEENFYENENLSPREKFEKTVEFTSKRYANILKQLESL